MTKSDVDSRASVNPYQVDYEVEPREPIKWSPAVLLLIFSVWCAVFGVCWLFARWDGAFVALACIALSYFAISKQVTLWLRKTEFARMISDPTVLSLKKFFHLDFVNGNCLSRYAQRH